MKTIVTTSILLAMLAGPTAFAGISDLRSIESTLRATSRTCELEATQAGFEVGAEGVAQLTKSIRGESFAIKVSAKLEDHTKLIVSVAERSGETSDVGMIELLLGVGTFETQTFKEPFSNVFPVDDVTAVFVRHGDKVLLKGLCTAK